MDIDDFARFIDELSAQAEADPRVIGLVLLGSTAERFRADEFSDHDFFVITESGEQESLRTDVSWLPRASDIAAHARETRHGLKVVYRDGHVLEFAIFDREELRGCRANHWVVAHGDDDIVAATTQAANWHADPVDIEREWALFTALLIIGVGRARRGEVVTAGASIRSHALGNLLRIVTSTSDDARLDALDPTRRLEQVFPSVAAEIADALATPPEECARRLLDLAETFAADHGLVVQPAAAQAVRRRFNW